MDTKLGPYLLGPNDTEENGIYCGDARELAPAIPDESVDLIFTDPVYDRIDDYRWLAETAARVLKQGGDVLVYLAHYHLDSILGAMCPPLSYRWLLIEKKISHGALIWSYRLYSHYIPLLWLTNGNVRSKLSRIDFQWGTPNGTAVNHQWSKNASRMTFWLHRFASSGSIILDFFCGGGAILEAAKLANCQYFAFEIDEDTCRLARERVRMTQPPLFVLEEPEQMAIEF